MNTGHRYFLELAYRGTNYHGWQIQPNAVTVQETLDRAISILLRRPIETLGCGRTDTGVHAKQFFAHFDGADELFPEDLAAMVTRLNALLPHDIAVMRVYPVPPSAHARFDATLRTYRYDLHFNKDPFKTDLSWLIKTVPDISAMNEAAGILREYEDFSCFSKSNTQVVTNNCRIAQAGWETCGDGLVFHISADRFLRNMVRAVVGTLVDIGYHKIAPDALRTIIESRSRSNAGSSVPACGLHLTSVHYPYIKSAIAPERQNA